MCLQIEDVYIRRAVSYTVTCNKYWLQKNAVVTWTATGVVVFLFACYGEFERAVQSVVSVICPPPSYLSDFRVFSNCFSASFLAVSTQIVSGIVAARRDGQDTRTRCLCYHEDDDCLASTPATVLTGQIVLIWDPRGFLAISNPAGEPFARGGYITSKSAGLGRWYAFVEATLAADADVVVAGTQGRCVGRAGMSGSFIMRFTKYFLVGLYWWAAVCVCVVSFPGPDLSEPDPSSHTSVLIFGWISLELGVRFSYCFRWNIQWKFIFYY